SEVPRKEPTKADRSNPTKTLPTDRISAAKQLEFLRAYAAASNGATRAVTVAEIAEITKAAASTIAMFHPFFMSIGLLQRVDTGSYMPSSDAINFLRAYEWNPDTASQKLASAFRDAWCGQLLIPKL